MHNICFICGKERFDIDRNSDGGFKNHIKIEHHLWNYLFFMYRIENEVDEEDYDGIESYVYEKVEHAMSYCLGRDPGGHQMVPHR